MLLSEFPFNADAPEEAALVRAVADGDRSAYTRLYSSYLEGLRQYIFLFTGDRAIAEEIVQDVFLKIWEKRQRLADVESFRSYLFRAAKNQLINHIRREKVRTRAFGYFQEQSASLNGQDTLLQFNLRQTSELLRSAIRALPARRKQVFLLSTEQGLSLDEIAEQLGISKNVVKKQLYSAYDSVRGYLVQHGEMSAFLLLATGLVSQ